MFRASVLSSDGRRRALQTRVECQPSRHKLGGPLFVARRIYLRAFGMLPLRRHRQSHRLPLNENYPSFSSAIVSAPNECLRSTFWLAVLAVGLVTVQQRVNASSTTVDGATVEKFTGGHTRVVWLTDLENKDTFAERNQLQLVGYDSRDGKGERIIWGDRANYYRPLITPDGQQIVISNRQTRKIYVIKWDESRPRLLKEPGCATEVWRDPNTGKIWVYYQENPNDFTKPVLRFPIDEPANVETVWSSSVIQALPSFQLSRDGKMAASTFPWPSSGVAELPDVAWRKHRDGCWPAMAPDDSYISWTFDGPHRNLFMTRAGEKESWTVNISNAPGVKNFEVYHPRWSNDVRYMVMTGPYTSGDKKIKLWDGADGVEIYIGKFDKELRAMDGWLKLTNSRIGEFFPMFGSLEANTNRASLTPPLGFPRQQVRNWPNFSNQFSASPTKMFGRAAEPDCCFSGATTRITASSSMAPATRATFVLEPRAVPASVPMERCTFLVAHSFPTGPLTRRSGTPAGRLTNLRSRRSSPHRVSRSSVLHELSVCRGALPKETSRWARRVITLCLGSKLRTPAGTAWISSSLRSSRQTIPCACNLQARAPRLLPERENRQPDEL